MSKGALSSLAFASSAVASGSLGYVFASTAPVAPPKFKLGNPQAKPKKFQLFGKDNSGTLKSGSGRRGSRTHPKFVAAPARGQHHPAIIRSDRLDEPADAPDPYASEGTGPKLERRVHSAPTKSLQIIEQQTREAQIDRVAQHDQCGNSTAHEARSPPSQQSACSAKSQVPTVPAAEQSIPRSPKSPQFPHQSVSEAGGGAPGGAVRPASTKKGRQNAGEEEDDEDEDGDSKDGDNENESDWDEGITPTTPRPLRCASIAFPPELTLSEEKQLELAAEFAKSVKPCENWDDDFDIDIETQALQVPSAVAAAQFSVRMDLHNIHDFAKQIEALKSLKMEAQNITKSIMTVGGSLTKVHSLHYAYASDWEQADVIIELGEIAHDEGEAEAMQNGDQLGVFARGVPSISIASIAEDEDDEEDLVQAFGSTTLQQGDPRRRPRHHRRPPAQQGQGSPGPEWGATLPSEKHLSVLKNILLDGLDPEAQRAIQPFLVGDSVQFSVEMMPGLLAHLKNLTSRLETHLSELKALNAA